MALRGSDRGQPPGRRIRRQHRARQGERQHDEDERARERDRELGEVAADLGVGARGAPHDTAQDQRRNDAPGHALGDRRDQPAAVTRIGELRVAAEMAQQITPRDPSDQARQQGDEDDVFVGQLLPQFRRQALPPGEGGAGNAVQPV